MHTLEDNRALSHKVKENDGSIIKDKKRLRKLELNYKSVKKYRLQKRGGGPPLRPGRKPTSETLPGLKEAVVEIATRGAVATDERRRESVTVRYCCTLDDLLAEIRLQLAFKVLSRSVAYYRICFYRLDGTQKMENGMS